MELPPHLVALEKAADAAGIKPGTFTEVWIVHDDWCALLNRRGTCNCEPEIHFGESIAKPQ